MCVCVCVLLVVFLWQHWFVKPHNYMYLLNCMSANWLQMCALLCFNVHVYFNT